MVFRLGILDQQGEGFEDVKAFSEILVNTS